MMLYVVLIMDLKKKLLFIKYMEFNIFTIPEFEIKLIGGHSHVYGFPTYKGMKQLNILIKELQEKFQIENILGIDLGCGDGKLIDFFNKNLKKSNWDGIELSEYRIENSIYKNDNNLIFGNLLDLDYSDYNFIFVNNVCFEDELCNKLEHKMFREFSGYFIFSKKILNNKLYRSASLIKDFIIETNWNKNQSFYLYKIFI